MTTARHGCSCAVDCEKCSHFTGRNGWVGVVWGCAKGHPSLSSFSTSRPDGCKDFHAAPRDEMIFRRFKDEASFHGADGLKTRQSQARRIATSLAKSLAEFGPILDSDQVQAGRSCVSALNSLADDIERAARMAKTFKAREDARRKAEQDRQADELVVRYLTGWTEEEVVQCAQDLAAFDSSQGMRWRDARRGCAVHTEPGLWSPNDCAQVFKRAHADSVTRAQRYTDLCRDLAQALQTLESPLGHSYATRADFDAWRQYLRDRVAAKASVHAVVATAAMAARGGPT